MKPITKIFIGIDILIVFCFALVYGPFDGARVFWITTSMNTLNHKYLAHIFYSEDTIKDVLSKNYYKQLDSITDISQVVIDIPEADGNYSSVYEKEILERDKDALYKLIQFKYNRFNCFLVAIYDPTRVHAVVANPENYQGKILTEVVEENDALVAINGGGYSWATGYPEGYVISNGKTIMANHVNQYATAGITKDGVLMVGIFTPQQIEEYNIVEALSFSPALIVNGEPIEIIGTGGSGQNPRAVIAQRKDGIMLFLVVDGYKGLGLSGRGGVYYNDLLEILKRYGAYNALNLDGGSSTTLVINNELINTPCEDHKLGQDYIRSAWILK